jgi:alkylation response protein AidB-like acyl-CoA dehydrogenase
MARAPIGLALSVINRIAGNPLLDRFGLRNTVERTAYHGTRAGFRTLAMAGKEFKRISDWLPRQRLPEKKAPQLFDLNPDADQQMIVDSLSRLARDRLRPAAAEADEASAMPADIYEAAAELGLPLYATPEAFGGVAETLSPVTSVLIAEELAWGDMAMAAALLAPFSVAQAITRWGTGEQQSRYLPAFCEEKPPVATIAVDEPRPLFDPRVLQTRATQTGTGYTLNGTKNGVVLGAQSDLILVAAELNGRPRVLIVEHSDAIGIREDPAMGLRAAQTVSLTFKNLHLPGDALLGDDDFGYQIFLDHGCLLKCGLAIGTARAVLDYVIPYCNEREAFGEPISHRQAVAFMISNLAIETDSMRLLTWRAASRAETGQEWHREASLARILCNEKAMEIGTNGVQLLGGHGFVKEHPVERWYRDLRSIATHFGGAHA